MSAIIFVTQVYDPDDPVLGFVTRWVAALSREVDEVAVIANEVRGTGEESSLVHSLGKERGSSRMARIARFQSIMLELTRKRRWTALVAHMCPSYVLAAAPICKIRGIPIALWFAHPAREPVLLVAEQLCSHVFTSLPGSYPGRRRDVHTIGQATAVPKSVPPLPARPPFRMLALGRTSPSKGLTTIVRATEILSSKDLDVRLTIVGPSTTDAEMQHLGALHHLVERAGLQAVVLLRGPVPPSQVATEIANSHLLVNAMVAGSGDKVVFEALAHGRLAVASNPSFAELLAEETDYPPLTFPPADSKALADTLERIVLMPVAEYESLASEVRGRVKAGHSIEGWAERIARILEGCSVRRGA